jgi:succinoglycan biosynthesis protein ExoO
MSLAIDSGPSVCLISRQRIIGRTNGSSAYILSIVEYLKANGFRIHYVSPSPSTFGRWPFMRLRPEMDVFDSIRIRGSVRVGRFLILLDPTVALRATVAVLDHFLARTRLSNRRFGRPAPYSIALPLSDRDADFLKAEVPHRADVLLLDYAFLTPCIGLVKRGDTPSIVVMHDLFSARAPQFDSLKQADSAARLSEAEEMALLSAADLVVAIQGEEAETVRRCLPQKSVVVAPMAVQPAAQPNPGDPDTILFVGSNTAPNVDGLRWFIEGAWPCIRATRPSARLIVAGSVAWSYSPQVEGVEYLGVVSELEDLYRRAGVVISPLRVGSGLKVKLVEAMGWGKAIVATSVTAQGIGSLVEGAIILAEEPEEFAAEVVALTNDEVQRTRYGEIALEVARTHFGEDACYSGILAFLAGHAGSQTGQDGGETPWADPRLPAATKPKSRISV